MPFDSNDDVSKAVASARQPDLVTEDDVAGTWSPRANPAQNQTVNSYSPSSEAAPKSFMEKLPDVLYNRFVDPMVKAITAPGRVYRGEVPENQMIDEAKNVAGQMMTGSFALGAPSAAIHGVEPNQLNMFFGPRSKTANLQALEEATYLEGAGLDRDRIWKTTGWGRGPDGQWFYEVPDNTAQLRALRMGAEGPIGRESTLGAEFEHPELYKAYPDLANLKFEHGFMKNANGAYTYPQAGFDEQIAIGPEDPKFSLLHEIQHAIQNREGWPRGGNPSDRSLMPIAQLIKERGQENLSNLQAEMHGYFDKYAREAGYQPNDPNRIDIIKAASQKWREENPEKAAQMVQAYKDAAMPGSARDAYQRLVGEIQANRTALSHHWDAADRRAVPAWYRGDFPLDKNQIIRYGTDEPFFPSAIGRAEGGAVRQGYATIGGVPLSEDDQIEYARNLATGNDPMADAIQNKVNALSSNLNFEDVIHNPGMGGKSILPGMASNMQEEHTVVRPTVDNPIRLAFPGVYERPDIMAAKAAARVAPEDPALKQVFGVTRDDLYQMSKGRQGTAVPDIMLGKGKTPDSVDAIMNQRNAQRLVDALAEAERYPSLTKGMDAWYTMDPLYQAMVHELGPELAAKRFTQMNTRMGMMSPGSDVVSEIQRGLGADYMTEQGRFPEFSKMGGIGKNVRPSSFPPELLSMPGHPYHSTSHMGPMGKFNETGELDMGSPKVPLYIQSSNAPELGQQTRWPVPDAHFARGVGMGETRTAKDFKPSMNMAEYRPFGEWYYQNVAQPLGLEGVPAQARQWGLMGHATGVETDIGAPKLEMLAQHIMESARRNNVDPITARNAIIRGDMYNKGGRADGNNAIDNALRIARGHFDEGGDTGESRDREWTHDYNSSIGNDNNDNVRADNLSQSEQRSADSQAASDARAYNQDVGRFAFGNNYNVGNTNETGVSTPQNFQQYTKQRLDAMNDYQNSLLNAAMHPSDAYGMLYPNLVGVENTRAGASGLLGSGMGESGKNLDPSAINGGSIGMFQDTGARAAALKLALGIDPSLRGNELRDALAGTQMGQLGFGLNEIVSKPDYAPTARAMATGTNAADVADVALKNFERPTLENQISSAPSREAYAQNIMAGRPSGATMAIGSYDASPKSFMDALMSGVKQADTEKQVTPHQYANDATLAQSSMTDASNDPAVTAARNAILAGATNTSADKTSTSSPLNFLMDRIFGGLTSRGITNPAGYSLGLSGGENPQAQQGQDLLDKNTPQIASNPGTKNIMSDAISQAVAAAQAPTTPSSPYLTELGTYNQQLPSVTGQTAQQWALANTGGDMSRVHGRIKYVNGAPMLEYYAA
jgi:hypothetical protein